MSYDIPQDRRYRETHEWVLREDGTVRIGITEFAQEELGDVVFVELPAVGDAISADESFGVVESIKAVSDLYAPVSGEVTAVNDVLFDRPELLNESPFEEGWLLAVDLSDPDELDDLLGPDAYADQIA